MHTYRKPSKDLTIIQVDAKTINPDIIHEKLPIFIHDRIVDPIDLVRKVFKYYFISIDAFVSGKKGAFTIMHVLNRETVVHIKHPKFSTVLQCKLYPHNVLMVPRGWEIRGIDKKFMNVFTGHTILSKLI